jgi:hypothetical protein
VNGEPSLIATAKFATTAPGGVVSGISGVFGVIVITACGAPGGGGGGGLPDALKAGLIAHITVVMSCGAPSEVTACMLVMPGGVIGAALSKTDQISAELFARRVDPVPGFMLPNEPEQPATSIVQSASVAVVKDVVNAFVGDPALSFAADASIGLAVSVPMYSTMPGSRYRGAVAATVILFVPIGGLVR